MKKITYYQLKMINSARKSEINKQWANTLGCKTVKEAKEYYDTYKCTCFNYEPFITLTDPNDPAKLDFKEDEPFFGREIHKFTADSGSIAKLKKLITDKVVFVSRTLHIGVVYHSTCSQWGDYNPHCYLFETITYRVGHDTLKETNKVEHLNYGSAPDISQSAYYKETISQYKDATITTRYIRYKRVICSVSKIIEIGKKSYHGYEFDTNASLYKKLQNKIAIEKANQKERRLKTKKFGRKITKAFLSDEYGFCEYGIDDWCDWIGINGSAYAHEIIDAYQRASKGTKKYIHENYATETAQVLYLCRQIKRETKHETSI